MERRVLCPYLKMGIRFANLHEFRIFPCIIDSRKSIVKGLASFSALFENYWMYLVKTHRFAFLKTFQYFSYLKLIDLCKYSFCSKIHIITPISKFWKWISGLFNNIDSKWLLNFRFSTISLPSSSFSALICSFA